MSNPVVEPAAEAAAGGAAPAAEAPMFPQFPGYKPSGRVISTRVLGTNHMGGGMPGAYNMAPQQPQYHQYPQYPHMAPPAQHDPPVHQGPYGPPYGPPHADSEECAIQMEHFAQQRDETEVAMSQRQDVAPPEYRGFNFVPRTSEGSTSHTSCPYYGFHDLPPGCAYVDPKVSVYPDTMHMRDPGAPLERLSLREASTYLPQPIPDIDEEEEARKAIAAVRKPKSQTFSEEVDLRPATFRSRPIRSNFAAQSQRGLREGMQAVGSWRMAFEDAVSQERSSLRCAAIDMEAELAGKFGPNTHGTVVGGVSAYNDHPYGDWANMGKHPVGYGCPTEHGVLPVPQRSSFHEQFGAPAAFSGIETGYAVPPEGYAPGSTANAEMLARFPYPGGAEQSDEMKAAIERSEAAWKEVHEKRGIWENSEVPAGVGPLSGYPTAPSKDAAAEDPPAVQL